MGRARFMFYTAFFIFFFVSYQTKTSALPNLNDVMCDVYSPKAVETLIHGHCYGCCCLYSVRYIFFWFYRSVGFEENDKYAKNARKGYYVNHRMR